MNVNPLLIVVLSFGLIKNLHSELVEVNPIIQDDCSLENQIIIDSELVENAHRAAVGVLPVLIPLIGVFVNRMFNEEKSTLKDPEDVKKLEGLQTALNIVMTVIGDGVANGHPHQRSYNMDCPVEVLKKDFMEFHERFSLLMHEFLLRLSQNKDFFQAYEGLILEQEIKRLEEESEQNKEVLLKLL